MLDGVTWRDEMAGIQRESHSLFTAYLRDQLAAVRKRRREPQTRDDHAILAAREAHYTRLIEDRT